MKKLLLAPMMWLAVLSVLFYSCGSSGAKVPESTIVGTWQLTQEFNNEGRDTPLKEFPLSHCDKKTTLEIMESGRFIEKSYYKSLSIAGECVKDNRETKGIWRKGNQDQGVFLFIYDPDTALSIKGSTITIENGNLIVLAVYNDIDLGPRTKLKFIYSKV
ncbi:hypothetical protein [Aquimarina sp. AU474]|uniref:hypothetical protein n=1 Tax=Aquimarina sp. AU474 TaxID=2108529 RepID=UPI000D695B44|nr:hypothetical protein [Aquimarina sp. AU474]